MKSISILLLLVLSLGSHGQSNQIENMEFLIGEWKFEAKSLLADGTYQPQEFYSKVEYIHNGYALKDDFHFKNQKGEWVLYGSTIRSFDLMAGKWKMLWYNFNLSSITEMTGTFQNGEFHFDGNGTDQQGSYIEKIVFYDIQDNQYKWKSDKSFDGGKTWMESFFSYTATRIN